MMQGATELITNGLIKTLPNDKERSWVTENLKLLARDFTAREFYLSFAQVHRSITDNGLELSPTVLQNIENIYPGFAVKSWTTRQLCRVVFMLHLDCKSNSAILQPLFGTADMHELVSLFKGVYFLDNASDFVTPTEEGVRTNITEVFDAIALHNPFPAAYFNENAWNQIVLKAIFMERPIYQIYGLEQRQNKKLAKIAQDFAHERWAAGRTVTPELWRLTPAFLDETLLLDLQKAIQSETPLAVEAAVKCIDESTYLPAKKWLAAQNIPSCTKTWNEIGVLTHQKNKQL